LIEDADLVVVGPAPPLRGGIAAHTVRLVEAARGAGMRTVGASYSRLYPSLLFPGRSQTARAEKPEWCIEILDSLSPPSWLRLRRVLARSRAKVVVQFWTPAVAPALLAATADVERSRLTAVCHNTLPHEGMPGAAPLARALLARCGRIVCHSDAERRRVLALLGPERGGETIVRSTGLPALIDPSVEPKPPPEWPAHWSSETQAKVLVSAGLVRPYKGIANLLRAWTLARRPPSARLAVAGEWYLTGTARREARALAESADSIFLIDRYLDDEELVFCLRSADALVCAHLASSQSGVVPLALALGVPVLATEAGGLGEQAGAAAAAAPGDVIALSAAIERRLQMPKGPPTAAVPPVGAPTASWREVLDALVSV
jgi:glycosyltransferase involved in cell wall biosynthesis